MDHGAHGDHRKVIKYHGWANRWSSLYISYQFHRFIDCERWSLSSFCTHQFLHKSHSVHGCVCLTH